MVNDKNDYLLENEQEMLKVRNVTIVRCISYVINIWFYFNIYIYAYFIIRYRTGSNLVRIVYSQM